MEMIARWNTENGLREAGTERRTRWIPTESRRTKGSAKRDHISCCICSSTWRGVTMRMRSPRPRRTSSARIMPISRVLPRPTVSASRMRGRRFAGSRAWRTAVSW